MKKVIVLFVLTFMLGVSVAKAYSVENFANVIKDGDISKDFKKKMENDGCVVNLIVYPNVDSLIIDYNVVCEEEKEEEINGKKETVKDITYNVDGRINYVLTGNVLVSSLDRTKDDVEKDPFYEKILALTPYWGTEMSSKYSSIKSLIKKNHDKKTLETFALIFDRCYMEEMGVCYSMTPGMNYSTYLGKVTLDDTGGKYAYKFLKNEDRELKNKTYTFYGLIVAGVLLLLILIAKGMDPKSKVKPLKY